jgi:hypothetical protein
MVVPEFRTLIDCAGQEPLEGGTTRMVNGQVHLNDAFTINLWHRMVIRCLRSAQDGVK